MTTWDTSQNWDNKTNHDLLAEAEEYASILRLLAPAEVEGTFDEDDPIVMAIRYIRIGRFDDPVELAEHISRFNKREIEERALSLIEKMPSWLIVLYGAQRFLSNSMFGLDKIGMDAAGQVLDQLFGELGTNARVPTEVSAAAVNMRAKNNSDDVDTEAMLAGAASLVKAALF